MPAISSFYGIVIYMYFLEKNTIHHIFMLTMGLITQLLASKQEKLLMEDYQEML